MISQRMEAEGGDQTGRWVAAGAINDKGTATATSFVESQGGGKARVRATHFLTSAAGMITPARRACCLIIVPAG
jgi:hypothetical protein